MNVKLPLAKACHELTGIPLEDFLSQKGKASLYKGIPLRNLLGEVGACMEKFFGEYHTIESALKMYGGDQHTRLVVDSLRMSQTTHFPGKVIEVCSKRSIETGNPFDEYERENIHVQIHNDGTLDELEKQVVQALQDLGMTL